MPSTDLRIALSAAVILDGLAPACAIGSSESDAKASNEIRFPR
jgi:hypothetical protein